MIVGHLQLDGYAGRTATPVEIISTTRTHYRIKAITRTKLAGRERWLNPGDEALIPHNAVRDNCERCHGSKGGAPGNENIIDGKKTCDYCHANMLRETV